MRVDARLVIAGCLALAPMLWAAFWPEGFSRVTARLSIATRVVLPGLLCGVYALVAEARGILEWRWFAVYLLLPVAVAAMLAWAARADPEQSGDWRDFVVLVVLGLVVDLRWFEPAWPRGLTVFNKVLLLDAGIWGFGAVRRLHGVGLDLRLRVRDLRIGLREFCLYAPVAVGLGLALGFLHAHARWPAGWQLPEALVFTFFFIAVPEELFFRGWMQNLLERRVGRKWALAVTAMMFGLAHFNKRALHFNWRYVLLAGIAGVFYGRAWRVERRVGASAVTHTLVDTVWSMWLR
ncbi:MAG TPA: CPBP family intramembrane glutamic endopeptidase [Candidatus Aquilonibacter sp.]|nr:CPBP family intramembrane glutamic endopeptidase [Candidatus Aquilonibacter sp.]